MSPLIPSNRDLSFDGNLTQARYELLKAIDRGGEVEQAAWTRDWGEATLTHAEGVTPDWDEHGPSERLIKAIGKANELSTHVHGALHQETPNLERAKEYLVGLRRELLTLNDCLEAEEG